MTRRSLNIVVLFVLLTLSQKIGAQFEIQLSTAKDSVKVGEDLSLEIELKGNGVKMLHSIEFNLFDSLGLVKYLFPEDSSLQKLDAIPVDFEISDAGNWPYSGKLEFKKGEYKRFEGKEAGVLENEVKIKVWDPGHFMWMLTRINYLGEEGEEKVFFPETKHAQLIFVQSPKGPVEGEAEIRPIKDILKEGRNWMDFKWLYISILLLALFLFLLNRPFKRKKRSAKRPAPIVKKRPAHEIALEKLNALDAQQLWQKDEFKAFQTSLSHISREYLENRYGIAALESTTREITRDLEEKALAKKDIDQIKDLLQIADLVKFAKAKPDSNVHQEFLEQAIAFVHKTKITEQKTEDKE